MKIAKCAYNYVLRSLERLTILKKIPDFYWANMIIDYKLDISQVRLDTHQNNLILDDFGITLIKNKYTFFLKALEIVKLLKEVTDAKFEIVNDEIRVFINGISLNVQTWEEFYILHEIFVNGIYNIITPKPVVILDVGMNTGFASLYFAALPYVVSVIAYEPFAKTYKQAEHNFSLNSKLAKKIKKYQLGLSETNEELSVDYCYECKGSIGISGIAKWATHNQQVSQERIRLISAYEAIDAIVKEYPDVEIVAKIDCEGSEYKIIKTLHSTGRLRYLKSIILEWHSHQENLNLMKSLTDSEFSIISLTPHSKTI